MAEQIVLPVNVTSRPDVLKLQRELEVVEGFFHQANLRKSGESIRPPAASKLLEELAQANNGNLLQPEDRQKLAHGLKQLISTAPVIHISFASSPSQKFIQKLTAWFRQEMTPNLLIDIGLQPSIAAGFTLRTSSKYFDFSLRKHLASHQPDLLEKMRRPEN